MKRKHVLFVTQSYNVWGGMEQWLDGQVSWLLDRTDWEVHVGVARGLRFNDAETYLKAHPRMPPTLLDIRVGTHQSRELAILNAIESLKPDLVVPLLSGAVFPAVARAKKRGLATRLLVPIYHMSQPGLFVNIDDYFGIVDGVVCNNRLFRDYWCERKPEEIERFHYVRNGGRKPTRIVERPLRHPGPLRCGYVGRIEQPQKRILDLIDFVRSAMQKGYPLDLHVYGDGPARGALQAALQSLGASVTFHGYTSRDELYTRVWPWLDVALLFSESEGWPQALCEAMMHGVVPISSRFPGVAAEGVLRHGETALLFPVGRPEVAAEQLGHLEGDRNLVAQLAHAAFEATIGWTEHDRFAGFTTAMEATLALPMKEGEVAAPGPPPAGRLDRYLSDDAADTIRRFLRLYHPHQSANGEWPSEAPFERDRGEKVVADLLRLDAEDQAELATQSGG